MWLGSPAGREQDDGFDAIGLTLVTRAPVRRPQLRQFVRSEPVVDHGGNDTVRQALHVKRLRLSDRRGGELAVTGVIAREVDPPAGVKLIVWRLLSNRRVADAELIDWYRARREIDLLFLVLKEGCRVEALQLGTSSASRMPWPCFSSWPGASLA